MRRDGSVRDRYTEGRAPQSLVQCMWGTRGLLSKLGREPPTGNIDVTCELPTGNVSVVTLIRTDTALDHSKKAENVCLPTGRVE